MNRASLTGRVFVAFLILVAVCAAFFPTVRSAPAQTSEFEARLADSRVPGASTGVRARSVSWTPEQTSPSVVALFAVGTAAVVLLLSYFLEKERYRRTPKPERGVGFVAARRAAEARLSALAPRIMLLAEKERALTRRLGNRTLSGEDRRRADGLLREAVADGVWGRFVAVSILVEEDPERAQEGLRRLSLTVEAALEKLGRAEGFVDAEGTGDAGFLAHG